MAKVPVMGRIRTIFTSFKSFPKSFEENLPLKYWRQDWKAATAGLACVTTGRMSVACFASARASEPTSSGVSPSTRGQVLAEF